MWPGRCAGMRFPPCAGLRAIDERPDEGGHSSAHTHTHTHTHHDDETGMALFAELLHHESGGCGGPLPPWWVGGDEMPGPASVWLCTCFEQGCLSIAASRFTIGDGFAIAVEGAPISGAAGHILHSQRALVCGRPEGSRTAKRGTERKRPMAFRMTTRLEVLVGTIVS
jgi:hypothetical protein